MGGDEVPTGAPAAAAVVLATLGVGSWPGAPSIPSSSPLLPGSPAGDGIGVEPHEADDVLVAQRWAISSVRISSSLHMPSVRSA